MPLIPPISFQTFSISRRAFALLLGVITAVALSSCSFLQPHADPTKFYVLTVLLHSHHRLRRWKRLWLHPVRITTGSAVNGSGTVVGSGWVAIGVIHLMRTPLGLVTVAGMTVTAGIIRAATGGEFLKARVLRRRRPVGRIVKTTRCYGRCEVEKCPAN
jgi:hypothetical protein